MHPPPDTQPHARSFPAAPASSRGAGNSRGQILGWAREQGALRGIAVPGSSSLRHAHFLVLPPHPPPLQPREWGGGISKALVGSATHACRRVPPALSRQPMALRSSPARSLPPELPALHSCPAETTPRSRPAEAACAWGGDQGGGGGARSRGVCQLPRGRGHLLPPPPLAPASRPPLPQTPPRSETLIPSPFWPSASPPPHLL